MGKGDKRSRKGKIFAGSYGKTRPKRKAKPIAMRAAATPPEAPKAKPRPRVKKKAEAQE